MLQDVDNMEASCFFYVEVGTLNQLEQSNVCVLTGTTFGIVILTVSHFMMLAYVSCKIPGIC